MVRYPVLYQINTRVWLRELADNLGRPATLADIPDVFLDQVAAKGFRLCLVPGLVADRPGGPAGVFESP